MEQLACNSHSINFLCLFLSQCESVKSGLICIISIFLTLSSTHKLLLIYFYSSQDHKVPSNNTIFVSLCGQGRQAQLLLKLLNKGIMLSRQALVQVPYASSTVARAKRIHSPGGNMGQMPCERYLERQPGSTPGAETTVAAVLQTEPSWLLGCSLGTGQTALPSPFLEFCYSHWC